MRYDPGADLAARYPDWVWRRRDLRGIPEFLCPREKVILTEREQGLAESRTSLAHAIAHIDLQHDQSIDRAMQAREESDADDLAARRLIELDALADALAWALGPEEVATELSVTTAVVRTRVRGLTADEKNYIERRIAAKGEVA